MKRLVIILFLILAGKSIFAQEKQLIIQLPLQSENNIYKIKHQLACLEGLHFTGYVKHASCILLKYNTNLIADKSIITTLIHHLNRKVKYKVIEGYTAYEVIDGKLKIPVSKTKRK